MFLRILILLTVVPMAELIILLKVHAWASLNWGPGNAFLFTVGSILLTGFLGANLARSQGIGIFSKIQTATARGEMPADSMVEGLMIFVGGALLLTPGYLTDLFGFSLMIPVSRRFYRQRIMEWFQVKIRSQEIVFQTFGAKQTQQQNDDVIDITPLEESEDIPKH